MKICIPINVIVPKLEYAVLRSMGREREVRKQLETVMQMIAANKVLGCSSTTSDTVLRAKLRMYPPQTNKIHGQVKMAI